MSRNRPGPGIGPLAVGALGSAGRQWPKLLQSPRNVVGRWGLGCGRGALVEGEEIDL